MIKKLLTAIGIVGLGAVATATSLLTVAGIWWGWDGKILNIQVYEITGDTVTIQWNKVVWATAYCRIVVPYFGIKTPTLSECENIWRLNIDHYWRN